MNLVKISAVLVVLLLITAQSIVAQRYNITTDQQDPFSKALVQLLNCGAKQFRECKGDSLTYTSLEGEEFSLTIPFPDSKGRVIKYRDWNKAAYVEFGSYADKKGVADGVKELIKKMKIALGEQLLISHELLFEPDSAYFMSSLGIKDSKGYFQPNIEIMTSSHPENHLLISERNSAKKNKANEYFILVKVDGGVPDYFYELPPGIVAPGKEVYTILQQLIKDAGSDFDSLHSLKKARKRSIDTAMLNDLAVIMHYGGQNYEAIIQFALQPSDTSRASKFWEHLHQDIQAALGTGYVFNISEISGYPFIYYFSKKYAEKKPVIYLEYETEPGREPYLAIKVRSNYYHSVKRNRMEE